MDKKDLAWQAIERVISQLDDTKSGAGKLVWPDKFITLQINVYAASGVRVLDEQKLSVSEIESAVERAFQKNVSALQNYAQALIVFLAAGAPYVLDTVLKQAFAMFGSVGQYGAKRIAKDRIAPFVDCVIDTLYSEDIPTASDAFELDVFSIIQGAFRKKQNKEDRISCIAAQMLNIISWKGLVRKT